MGEDEAQALKLPKPEGALVRQVERGSPAEQAGIQPGDVIVEYQGKAMKNADDLVALVTATPPGTHVPVVLLRNGSRQTVSVTIEELEIGADTGGPNSGAGLAWPWRI